MLVIFGIALITVGAWFDYAHKHLTLDARYVSAGAILLGFMILVTQLVRYS